MKKVIFAALMAAAVVNVQAQKKDKKEPNKKETTQKSMEIELNKEYTSPSGLKYKFTERGTGAQAEKGSNVSVHYVGTLLNGKKFDSSRDRGNPISFKLGTGRVIKGWDEGIAMLRVGDKAVFTIPPDLGYGARAMGDVIPANSTLVFEVELMGVTPPVKPWELKHTDTVKTESGLKYIVVERTTSTDALPAMPGRQVSVHYTGFLSNGTIFDSSVERGEPFTFLLGAGQVIKGWDEGIALMKVGDKLRLVIPPDLGYGASGGGAIPPNSTLYFDVELMKVQ